MADLSAPYWRWYLPLEPGGVLRWQGDDISLAPGHWILVAPQTPASSHALQPFRKLYQHFMWTVPGCQPRPGVITGRLTRPRWQRLRRVSLTVLDEPTQPVFDPMTALGLELQAEVAVALASLNTAAFDPDPELSPLIAQAVKLLQHDPAHTPDNASLGRALGLHPGSLVRRFTGELGVSPQRFALRWRLDVAAAMLAEGIDSIEVIADATGFGDRHHFSRAFRRQWQCPPAEFRTRAQG